MTKKHFVAIATRLSVYFDEADTGYEREKIRVLANDMAKDFAQFNANFDADTFMNVVTEGR